MTINKNDMMKKYNFNNNTNYNDCNNQKKEIFRNIKNIKLSKIIQKH